MAYMKDSTGRRLDSFAVSDGQRAGTYAVLGDSISEAGTNANQGRQGHAWHSRIPMILRQRVRKVAVFATAGYTLEQIRDTHLPSVLAMSNPPEACIVAGGTNNVSTPAPQWAALLTIIAALEAKGIRPILWLVPPRGDAIAAVSTWNAKVQALAARKGYQLVDAYTPLVDPASGSYKAGLAADSPNIHPTKVGHFAIASHNAAIPGWQSQFGIQQPYLTRGLSDAVNLVDSNRGLFLVDANADGLSDGLTVGAAGTGSYSRVTGADGYVWQRITKASSGTGARSVYRLTTSGFAAGDRLALSARVEVSSADLSFTITAIPRTSGVANPDETTHVQAAVSVAGGALTDAVVYGENAVPAGTTDYQVVIQIDSGTIAADAYLGVAQLTLINLTALAS